jgi:large subunit ribosomal protein L23
MITEYDIIHSLIRSEKASFVEPQGKYVFEVARGANKIEIKKAVEAIYKVKVAEVRTMVMPGKRKRVRQEFGHTPSWKKAIVSLREGQKIEIK